MGTGYVCENLNCSAPDELKGKVFPAAMDCIFCNVPLTLQLTFSAEEEALQLFSLATNTKKREGFHLV